VVLDHLPRNAGHIQWCPSEHVSICPQEGDERAFLFGGKPYPYDEEVLAAPGLQWDILGCGALLSELGPSGQLIRLKHIYNF
jgi:hypothetical protein